MNQKEALAFVERHGIVLQAARGPLPNLAETIAGGAIRGSWWGHPKGKEIFRAVRAICQSQDVLVCKLVEGKDYIRASPSVACIDQACLSIPQRTAGQSMGRAHSQRNAPVETRTFSKLGITRGHERG